MAITVVKNKGAVPKIAGGIIRMVGFKNPYPQMQPASTLVVNSGIVPHVARGFKDPYPQMQTGSTVVVPGGFRISPVKPLPGTGGGGGGGGTVGYGI